MSMKGRREVASAVTPRRGSLPCRIFCMAILAAARLFAGDYSVRQLELNHPDGFYRSGEEVIVSGQLFKSGVPAAGETLCAVVKWEGKEVDRKEIPCNGEPFRIAYRSETPGWVYFAFMVKGPDGQIVEAPGAKLPQGKKTLVAEIGAIYDKEKIRTAVEMPNDFQQFWKDNRAKLDQVPFNARLEKLQAKKEGVELYAVTVDAGVDRPVTAYLAYPAGAGKGTLAAYVSYLSWSSADANRGFAENGARRGLLTLAASWHGLPVNQPGVFYGQEIPKVFNARRNIKDRDKWEFRGVYMRVLRALDFIKSRPEWNGKTLVVQGGSLGGAQTAVAAALDPQVTTAIISVPCFCEFSADLAGRKRSIPVSGFQMTPEVRNVLNYYDVVNFATLIRCEVFFCTGYSDELCPPSNVIAAYNNLPPETRKSFSSNPATGHYGTTVNVKGNQWLKTFFQNVKVNAYTEKY